MRRHSSDGFEDAASGLVGLMLMVAVIVIAVIIIVLVSLVTELWRIYKTRAFEHTQHSRILWSALATLVGLWLVAGLLATSPSTASMALVIGCWSFFIFVLICLAVDWYSRRTEPKVPKNLALSEVVSWRARGTPQGDEAAVKKNGSVTHATITHE